MKITFVLPDIGISGGVKVVFNLASYLRIKGHDVSIIYPLMGLRPPEVKWYNIRNLVSRIKGAITKLYKKNNYLGWFGCNVDLIRVPTLAERYIPDADIIVATWWQTAYYVSGYNQKKGIKFYLIQHYEIWGGPKEEVENTYKLGLHNIVISAWLKDVLQKLKAPVEALIPDGINFKEFYPEKIERIDNKIRVLMPYRRQEWKGVKDGLKAFKIVKNKYNNVKLVMFGPNLTEGELPYDAEFHLLPTSDELRRIYNSCDIFCFPSHVEGFGLPPMEAMACKVACAVTDVGAVSDYTIPGKTALVSTPRNPKALAQNIIKLIENNDERKQIAENGYSHIKQFTWERATNQLEKLFERYVK